MATEEWVCPECDGINHLVLSHIGKKHVCTDCGALLVVARAPAKVALVHQSGEAPGKPKPKRRKTSTSRDRLPAEGVED